MIDRDEIAQRRVSDKYLGEFGLLDDGTMRRGSRCDCVTDRAQIARARAFALLRPPRVNSRSRLPA